jgi:hypothetical protein
VNELPCGNATILVQIDVPKIELSYRGLWYSTHDGETQSSAHALGKLMVEGASAGCTVLIVDLSKTANILEAIDEVAPFADALRKKGWTVEIRLTANGPSRPPKRAPTTKSRNPKTLHRVYRTLVRAEHVAFRLLLLGSLAVNGGRYLIYEGGDYRKAAMGAQVATPSSEPDPVVLRTSEVPPPWKLQAESTDATRALRKHWGETGGTPRVKDKEIGVRTGNSR